MAKKSVSHGLGRGLGALLGEIDDAGEVPAAVTKLTQPSETSDGAEKVENIPITKIDPNRDQPRKTFDEGALGELAQSIASIGVLQPILLRHNGNRYSIVAGERRWRAARLAGLTEIPAIVREWDENQRLEAALVENLQRDDLNPIEEALGVRALMDKCSLTQEAVAQKIGRSRPAIANLLRLLTLPEEVLPLVRDGKLSAGHARALAGLTDAERQKKLALLTVQQGWSVRQLERICAQPPLKKVVPVKPHPRAPEIAQLEKMAREVFGTHARLDGDENKGRLILQYAGPDDLERIWDILEFMQQSGS